MTIKRKRVNSVNALVEVEADPTDIVDVDGFSDLLSVVGAKSAKFSDTSNMTPNAGLKVGILKTVVKIDTSAVQNRSVIQSLVSSPENAIDSDLGTKTGITTTNIAAIMTVDFGIISTTTISAKVRREGSGGTNVVLNLYKSTDNINYDLVASNSGNTAADIILNGGTETYRYARLNMGGNQEVDDVSIYEIYSSVSDKTVSLNIRASDTIDSNNGVILNSAVIDLDTETELTLDTELYLVDSGKFYTLEIVSFSGIAIPLSLENITSVKEV